MDLDSLTWISIFLKVIPRPAQTLLTHDLSTHFRAAFLALLFTLGQKLSSLAGDSSAKEPLLIEVGRQ